MGPGKFDVNRANKLRFEIQGSNGKKFNIVSMPRGDCMLYAVMACMHDKF